MIPISSIGLDPRPLLVPVRRLEDEPLPVVRVEPVPDPLAVEPLPDERPESLDCEPSRQPLI